VVIIGLGVKVEGMVWWLCHGVVSSHGGAEGGVAAGPLSFNLALGGWGHKITKSKNKTDLLLLRIPGELKVGVHYSTPTSVNYVN
jgi:hypothetical protein